MSVSIEARTAARWWADQIRQGAKLDNGEGMHGVLGAMLQAVEKRGVTDEMIDAYEEALARSIQTGHRSHDGTDWRRGGFGVDYGPDRILSAPMDEVGLKGMTLLPWKTVMWISDGSVRVSHGYQAGIVEVPLITPTEQA